MEILGTHLSFTLGAWRVRFTFAIEDCDAAHQHAADGLGSQRLLPANGQNRISPLRR